MENEKTYVEEVVRIIRPTTSNHVWNEERYEKTESYDSNGLKQILLREKTNEQTAKVENI